VKEARARKLKERRQQEAAKAQRRAAALTKSRDPAWACHKAAVDAANLENLAIWEHNRKVRALREEEYKKHGTRMLQFDPSDAKYWVMDEVPLPEPPVTSMAAVRW